MSPVCTCFQTVVAERQQCTLFPCHAAEAVIKQLEDASLGFDREGWLAEKEPHMRKRFEELFKTQDALDEYFSQLQKERHELEQKYIKLCGADPCRKL